MTQYGGQCQQRQNEQELTARTHIDDLTNNTIINKSNKRRHN